MKHTFFAFVSRLKYINRWALMRNTAYETLSQHSHEVATLSHALAVIGNRRLGKSYDAARAALLGLYHDVPEIITGDMPTPVKYHSRELRQAFAKVEDEASERLLALLPADVREDFTPLFFHEDADEALWKLVKCADKLSALIKCIEERKAGNTEFSEAERAARYALEKSETAEVKIFLDEFLPAYDLPLDKMEKENA